MKSPYPKSLALICLVLPFFSCSSNDSEQLTEDLDVHITSTAFELKILDLINIYRVSKGLKNLDPLNIIKSQTENHTNYMIAQNEISHDNFPERNQFLNNNANAIKVTENVASGFTAGEILVNAWINSDSHRKNIEGDFTHFHISALQNAEGKWYFTNIFIKK